MMKNKTLKFSLNGLTALCLCFAMACSLPNDKRLNKKYESNDLNSITYKEGMTVSGTLYRIATEIEKKGTYMIHLGFHPATADISDFEQILRNDFDGEIEIFSRDGRPYQTIRYQDFVSFAWSPGKDAYGPVYYFYAESPGPYSSGYMFSTKIRSNEAYVCSFYLQRVKKSFLENLSSFFKSETQINTRQYMAKNKNPILKEGEINVLPTERFDISFEKKGNYIIRIVLRPTTEDSYSDFAKLTWNDFDGIIEIRKNGNPYIVIHYDDTKTSGSSLSLIESSAYSEKSSWRNAYISKSYQFNIDEPGIYSIIPEMKSKKEFKFSISINRIMWRK